MGMFGDSLRRRALRRAVCLCWLAAFLMCLPACGSQRGTTSHAETSWVVTIGSEGGFTGGGSGYRLYADGRVESWVRHTAQAEPEFTPIGKVPQHEVDRFYKALTGTTQLGSQINDHGNMTTFLEWREGESYTKYTWVEGDTPAAPLATAYEAAMMLVRSLQER